MARKVGSFRQKSCQLRPDTIIIKGEDNDMGKETRLFKSEERRSRAEVSQFLHEIADKIAGGQVVLRQGSEELVLEIPANLILEVQVEDEDKKTKGIQHSLEIELKWFDDDGASGPLELG
jgi:amphi-Trp domain-containing protein